MLIGIVGKPSCGKSTFFKAATLAEVEIANYPFTTIKPNRAVGFVRVEDPARAFGKVSNPRTGFVAGPFRFVPVDLIDVAGLVPGAHQGEGMGLQFLNDLNQADALVHVVDASGSTNEKGEFVGVGGYDPLEDVRFLDRELDFWFLSILKKGWEKFARSVQQTRGDIVKALAKQLSGVGVDEELVKEALETAALLTVPPLEWTEEALFGLAKFLRRKTKPMLIAANKADMPGALEQVERLRAAFPDVLIIPCSAESELALREAAKQGLIEYIPGEREFVVKNEAGLSDRQRSALAFIREKVLGVLGSTGVQDVLNQAVFTLLKRKAVFPGGVGKLEDSEGRVLPDCFLMEEGATALDFAYRLHSDFGNNFIKAINVRTKLPVGKDHVLENGDIIEIMARK
ncbi:redox-regulated ATPase YchF [Candidatus Woesearchaeota archaeon]|nr:MAG: redox-regulated ATPase YchF [Candidatus Woesearchaeota archaeon]